MGLDRADERKSPLERGHAAGTLLGEPFDFSHHNHADFILITSAHIECDFVSVRDHESASEL